MAITATKAFRLTAGLAVSIGVLLAADLLPWRFDVAGMSTARLYAELGATAGIMLFVARVMAASFLAAVSRAYSPDDVVPFLVANLDGLSLVICGSVFGAVFGTRFATEYEVRNGGAQ